MSFTEDERRKLEFIVGKELARAIISVNQLLEANRDIGSPSAIKTHDEAIALLKKELTHINI